MADTGSEIAEGTTRSTSGFVMRMLERRFLWDRPHGGNGPKEADDIAIGVRCPAVELDRRAEEVLEALERQRVRAHVTLNDEAALVTVVIPQTDLERAQRALERLHASKRSGFSVDDVVGLDLIEEATGRRTLGRTDGPRAHDEPTAEPPATEASTLTFDNHPDEPNVDEAHASAYARGMRDLGFDASRREVVRLSRGGNGVPERGRRQVVAVTYPTRERDDFATASAVVLHRIGALADFGAEDPYAGDPELLERDERRLAARTDPRDGGPRDEARTDEGSPAAEASGGAQQPRAGQNLSADEYRRLPARERAKVEPQQIPKEAFGAYTAREVAREQSAAASVINAAREPSRSHPDIGERVG